MAHERSEHELIDAARRGDRHAFDVLIEAHRRDLHAHCYRMLGSIHDAEDALQDSLLRAWRGLARFEGRSAVRSWLYRIATNVCLDVIARRPRRLLAVEYGPSADRGVAPGRPLTESVWVEPYPDDRMALEDGLAAPEARYERRESVELAFVAALQHLPGRQRAALLLHDVLGFSAREVADALDGSEASVNSALQRARKRVEDRVPERSQQATLRSVGDERVRRIVREYVDAWERDDVAAVVAMLTEDATWSMPPMTTWYRGLDAVTTFLTDWPAHVRWRHVPVRANGQLAVAGYRWMGDQDEFTAYAIDVLTLDGPRIAAVTAFVMADMFPAFGLPGSLPARGGGGGPSNARSLTWLR